MKLPIYHALGLGATLETSLLFKCKLLQTSVWEERDFFFLLLITQFYCFCSNECLLLGAKARLHYFIVALSGYSI